MSSCWAPWTGDCEEKRDEEGNVIHVEDPAHGPGSCGSQIFDESSLAGGLCPHSVDHDQASRNGLCIYAMAA
jgi:hypothetical protein